MSVHSIRLYTLCEVLNEVPTVTADQLCADGVAPERKYNMRRSSRLKGKKSCQIGDKNEGVKEDNIEALATQACAFITQRISSSKSDASHVPVVTSSPALSRGDGQAEEFIGLSTEFRKKSKE